MYARTECFLLYNGTGKRALLTGVAHRTVYPPAQRRDTPGGRPAGRGGRAGKGGDHVSWEVDANFLAVVPHPVIDNTLDLVLVGSEIL